MMRKNGITTLQAKIEKELNDIRIVVQRLAPQRPQLPDKTEDEILTAGYAAHLHSFYNGVEKVFALIAEYLDDFEPRGGGWHRELLRQMTLEISGTRPPVLSDELAKLLEEYLDFRHYFRHSYTFDLDWEELLPKIKRLPATFEQLDAALQNFFSFLNQMQNEID